MKWQAKGSGLIFRSLRNDNDEFAGLVIELVDDSYSEGFTAEEASALRQWLWKETAGWDKRVD